MQEDPRTTDPKVSHATTLRIVLGMLLFGLLFWWGVISLLAA